MVNLAGFRMALVDDGVETFESRVVIGKTRFPTAEFSDVMEFMVVNPAWHVPTSIVRNEILPKLREDPTYLTRQNMVLTGVDVDPEMIAWEFITPSTFPGRVKQRPGRNNALGQVKFKFPNHHAIYLHDTPQKSLFRHDRRAYSHGCVRVMKPYEFAHRLLERQLSDPEAMFNRWLARETEIYVHLDDPVPVHITYRTAPVAADGSDQFRGDVYGRDRRIAAALEDRGVRLPPA
jgi:murein L,D-transpeptidase YcbB/YkuD